MQQSKLNSWESVAARMWPVLTAAAAEKDTLSYKKLGLEIGLHHRTVKFALDVIYRYCSNSGLPALTGIVVRQDSGLPGRGFTEWDDLDTGLARVFAENWSARPNPFMGFGSEDTLRSFADRIVQNPETSGDVYRQVRDRGIAQQIFREGLLRAYEHKCAMCDLSFEEALEAAHIVPFNECSIDQRINVTNGLLLCATHHRLFDADCFSIQSDYSIVYYDPKLDDGPYTVSDKAMSSDLHGRKLRVPKLQKHRPIFDD
ncbi:HNH endonuclease [Bradyrhizobium sp. 168]|uniref:HNH endonuclease n=1 Tax=unclassified Bradyrhizobium TaxID=2631580 RepID=UPI001FFBCE26|nr:MULTISPECIES: HNH endonuclease [unclassified Bradyrhizobium]MCK1582156.1 HNH endonuclease [Bradyrhizobium sp. 168]UPK11627.1 HNH endonuclease [Bradyrhizobium sp. 155]UPK19531.1 HNH endonuclease [Bradyrhizobium sp. 131]